MLRSWRMTQNDQDFGSLGLTPGLDHRGARRIVTGGQPPEMYYYTDDHYDSFRSFQVAR